MFISLPRKRSQRVIPLDEPEDNHAAEQDGDALPALDVFPELHERFHIQTGFNSNLSKIGGI
jgi:hypothetical protein